MKKAVPRVAAINDLSGFGRASLHSIIPVLSTMGNQVCAVPTAVLSTHTGGFENYTFVDLTDTMEEYLGHWKSLKIDFDCIYSGFLGSPKQINIISDFIKYSKTSENLVVIDPVMGDEGKLYDTMDKDMVLAMRNFISLADLITPNFTEASYLLNKKYDKNISVEELKNWLVELTDMGPEIVIITSVPENNNKGKTGVVAYNKRDKKFWKVLCEYIPAYYPGTGDIFTSVIIGSLLEGDSLPISLDRAVQFITAAIRESYGYDYPKREGVVLERVLPNLKLPVFVSSYEML